jgi:hypothetical protein
MKYKCKERERERETPNPTLPLPKVYQQQLHVQLYASLLFLLPNEN